VKNELKQRRKEQVNKKGKRESQNKKGKNKDGMKER
jgi:hypothetical protein